MTPTTTTYNEKTAGDVTLPVPAPATDGRDQEIARAFFARVDREAEVAAAVVDYERRVQEDRPYEDATSLDELRRAAGR